MRRIITILEPIKIGFNHALRVARYKAELAYINAMLKAEEIGDLLPFTFAKTHLEANGKEETNLTPV